MKKNGWKNRCYPNISVSTVKRAVKKARVSKLTPEEKAKVLSGKSGKKKNKIIDPKPNPRKKGEMLVMYELQKWWSKADDKTQKSFLNWVKEGEEYEQ